MKHNIIKRWQQLGVTFVSESHNIALVWVADKDSLIVHRFPAAQVIPFKAFVRSNLTQDIIRRLQANLVALLRQASAKTGFDPEQFNCSVRFLSSTSALPELLNLAKRAGATAHYQLDSAKTRGQQHSLTVLVKNLSFYRHVLLPLFQMIVSDLQAIAKAQPTAGPSATQLTSSMYSSIVRSVDRLAVSKEVRLATLWLVQDVLAACACASTSTNFTLSFKPVQLIEQKLASRIFEPVVSEAAAAIPPRLFYVRFTRWLGQQRGGATHSEGDAHSGGDGDRYASNLWAVVPKVGLGLCDIRGTEEDKEEDNVGDDDEVDSKEVVYVDSYEEDEEENATQGLLFKLTSAFQHVKAVEEQAIGLGLASMDKVVEIITQSELEMRRSSRAHNTLLAFAVRLPALRPVFQAGVNRTSRPRFSVLSVIKVIAIVKVSLFAGWALHGLMATDS